MRASGAKNVTQPSAVVQASQTASIGAGTSVETSIARMATILPQLGQSAAAQLANTCVR
jgi:hypothetical protein